MEMVERFISGLKFPEACVGVIINISHVRYTVAPVRAIFVLKGLDVRLHAPIVFIIAAGLVMAIPAVANPILLIGLLVWGLPHGAFDLEILRRDRESQLRFFCIYGLIAFGIGLLYFASSSLTSVAFVLLSAYHFGEDLEVDGASPGKRIKRKIQLIIFGLIPILAPVAFHSDQVLVLTSSITAAKPLALLAAKYRSLFVSFVALIIVYRVICIQKFEEVFRLLAILSVLALTPITYGFSLYFVYWHSLQAFESQRRELSFQFWTASLKCLPLGAGALGITVVVYEITARSGGDTGKAITAWLVAVTGAHILTRSFLFRPSGILHPVNEPRRFDVA